jgi:hypothetical protein
LQDWSDSWSPVACVLEEYLSQSFEAGTRSERKINQIMDYEKNLAK